MKFHIPQVPASQQEAAYAVIAKAVKEQMRINVTPRRIFGINYLHDKKRINVRVGEHDPHDGRHIVLAILESSPYVVYTRQLTGGPGVNILVNKDEITEILDFS